MPLLTISIIFFLWLAYEIKKHNLMSENGMKDFWTRERDANSTRRKPLNNLAYITIPLSDLPVYQETDHEKIRGYQETILSLADKKILNLTGLSNTDLKLAYGAPNITFLMACDQNFTTLAGTLANWGEALLEEGFTSEGKSVLEFGITCNTDVSKNYLLLGKLYVEEGNYAAIEELIRKAQDLQSLSRKHILNALQEMMPV